MAQLKNTIVTGNLQVTEKTISGAIKTPKVEAPTTSGGTTYGAGTSGQVLKTNGTTVYWGADTASKADAADITTTANAVAIYTDANGTFGTKATSNGAAYATSANGALTFGTLPVAQGGTGKTTGTAAANYFMNSLDTGSSTPVDADYYISQYVNGGTTTTTYHRRPMSALWAYIKGKISSILGISSSTNGVPLAPTASAGTNTTQIATTAFVKTAVDNKAVPSATTTTPKMDGTAAVGSETTWAKGDHVHPTDTSRAPLASPALTGIPTAPTATDGNNSTQIATTAYVDNHDVPYMKVVPMQSKTYTGVIGTANNWSGATFFFGSIRPTTFYETWSIKLRLRAVSGGVNNSKLLSDIVINGSYNSLTSYSCFNSVINTSYRAVYYVELYRLKEAGFNAGYGHALGIRLYSAWNPTTAANARTVDIEIYECINCSFEFFDAMTPYASIPGTGTTNYDTYSELNVADNGLQETGDANSTFAYQIRRYNGTYLAKEKVVRYMICVQCSDTELLPMNSTDNTIGTTKVMTTSSFNPFGQIFYYGTTTNVNAGAAFGTSNLYTQTYNIDGRYSFNWGSTLTSMKSIYLVCVPQSDGMVKLHTTPWSQNLPTTEDGYVYIYLGEATSTYQFLLEEVHPVYYFKDGEIRLWTNPTTVIETKASVPSTESSPLIKVGSGYYLWK